VLPWLRRILLHRQIDGLRRAARGVATADVEPDHLGHQHAIPMDATDEVQHLLSGLGEPERSLLWRFHHEGASISQLSREHDLPSGTIKSHLHRARRLLARRFRLGPGAVLERRSEGDEP
jgi:RNA polymerase sigma-70 factor (ECF subfamily)